MISDVFVNYIKHWRFFINMTLTMIEWLKLTFSRNVNRKRLGVLICFWHKSQYLINCFRIDQSISWFDCFRKFSNFLIEKWLKRLCNFCSSISIKKRELQLKNSMMQFCKTLFYSKNKCLKRQITEMIDFFWTRVLLMLL